MWLRNLGRDDRLVSDWGREPRHPFLDEGLMDALLSTPLALLTDPARPPRRPGGAPEGGPPPGDKRILREALRLLGLPAAAAREKRAIQFGSRLARAANLRDFGSNRAAAARNAGSVLLDALPAAAAAATAAVAALTTPSAAPAAAAAACAAPADVLDAG